MGLLNELNTINRTIENYQQKELTKAQLKENEKKRQTLIYKLLFHQFSNCFEEVTTENKLNILIKELLKNKGKNIVILSEYLDKPTKNDIDYIEKIYISTMNEAKKDIKILLNIEKEEKKLQEIRQKEEERQEQIRQKALNKEWIRKQKEKQIAFNNIIIALKTITLILATPFLLLGFIIFGICKNIK